MKRREFVTKSGLAAGSVAVLAQGLTVHQAGATGSDGKIRVGQIGVAHAHARGKMAAMRKYPDTFEVIGIVEPDESLRETRGRHAAYQDLKWMTEEELLNYPGLAAVAVETRVRDLVPTAHRCIAAKKHIHLDKPPGESLQDFKTLLDEATGKDLTVQMGYMLRYNPCFQFAYKWAREGRLGALHTVHAEMSKMVSPGIRKEMDEYRGGSMFELGCHVIDSVVFILGNPTLVSAHTLHTRPAQDTLADNQVAVFDYEGATAFVRSALNEVDGSRRRQFHVMGQTGQIGIHPLEGHRVQLALTKSVGSYSKGFHEIELPRSTGRYDGEFLELAKVIRGEKSLAWTPEHDLVAHETMLKACGIDE